MGVGGLRAVLPPLQLLVLLVQLRQELVALVGDLVGLLSGRLLDLGGLDHDLRLHAYLHVLVLHHHHAGVFPGRGWGWGHVAGRRRGGAVGGAAVGGEGTDEVVDAVAEAGQFRQQVGELELLGLDCLESGQRCLLALPVPTALLIFPIFIFILIAILIFLIAFAILILIFVIALLIFVAVFVLLVAVFFLVLLLVFVLLLAVLLFLIAHVI